MNISVITCTLNSMRTLPQTVESVAVQTHPDVEHIFVDGGSTDGTLEYIHSLDFDKKIVYGVEGGISRAMNAGALVAKGEILCHLHSDDYFLHPRVLARVAVHFEETGLNWLFGRILSDVDGGLVPESYLAPNYSHQRLLRGNFIPHPAAFVRARTFKELGGFREDLRFAMDYEFFLRLGLRYEPAALSEALTVFRRHEGSATQRNRLASFEEDHQVRCEFVPRYSWRRVMHAARYIVRRRRLLALLDRGERAG